MKHVQDISIGFYGDPNASYVSNKISIALPTALSLQFDFHFEYNLYFGISMETTFKNPQQYNLASSSTCFNPSI